MNKTTQAFTKAITNGDRDSSGSYRFKRTDVAACIRALLAQQFPGIKFWVRTHSYAGGSSLDVEYNGSLPGAPEAKAVEKLVKPWSTDGFDGMIDMAYNLSRWVMPDCTIAGTVTQGTTCSRGVHDERNDPKPHPEAVLMRGGIGYVFVNSRRISAPL